MKFSISKPISACRRCGTCCLKGGPVLHHEDKRILRSGHAGYEHLMTVRKGERVYNPVSGRLEYVPKEVVKVAGTGEDWSCCFYHGKEALCGIYEQRFLECRLLKCWDTSEIEGIIGRGTIVRSDVINADDPIMRIIAEHERECPVYEMESLVAALPSGKNRKKIIDSLNLLIRRDMEIRSYAVSEIGLRAEYELFIFGRPVHKLLSDRGLAVCAMK